jgi:4-amino-4-deoxy-L-arabinose transferase-like glycosyltransferase
LAFRPAASLLLESVLLAVLIVIAAFLRFHDLPNNPPGLHGDEAISGLEGRRILAEGWIGPYSPHALGQPTGPLYLTALSLRLFGESIFAVRFMSALLGVLTVVALYVVLRRAIDTPTALVGAGFLAVMGWHLHFSRIGFPLAAWPLVVVLTIGAAQEAARRSDPRWWALAGGLSGLGVYIYNAQPLVIAVIVGFVVFWLNHPLTGTPADGAGHSALTSLLAFAGALGLAVLPMVFFAAGEGSGYLQHYQATSLFNQPAWTEAATHRDRAGLLLGRYSGFWIQLCCQPRIDGVDATGVGLMVPLPLLALSASGLAVALWRRSGLWAVLGALLVIVLPVTTAITVEGAMRRTLALAPLLASFAGYGVVTLWRLAAPQGPVVRAATAAVLAAVAGLAVFQSLDGELRVFPASQEARWVFASEMTEASSFMACLGQRHHVYFLSDRWPANYETRQFLAPDVSIEDRSLEFGQIAGEDRSAALGQPDLEADPAQGAPVFVLLGRYREEFAAIRRRYPGGESVRGQRGADGQPTFVAYFPPRLTPDGAAKPEPPELPERCRTTRAQGEGLSR